MQEAGMQFWAGSVVGVSGETTLPRLASRSPETLTHPSLPRLYRPLSVTTPNITRWCRLGIDCGGWKRSLPPLSCRRCSWSDGDARLVEKIKRGSRCEPGYSRELTGSLEPALAVAERERGGATLAMCSHTRATLTHSHEGPHEV